MENVSVSDSGSAVSERIGGAGSSAALEGPLLVVPVVRIYKVDRFHLLGDERSRTSLPGKTPWR